MGLIDKMRNKIRSFLRIEEAQSNMITITEQLDFVSNAAKNRIWYRGKADELSSLYRQIPSDRTTFWSAVPTYSVRKAHTGLPKLIVDTLTSLVLADMNGIELPEKYKSIWDEIAKENSFDELINNALSQTLIIGDGAFKIKIDTDISQYPTIDFYSGDEVEFVKKSGRIFEIIFKSEYIHNGTRYVLNEIYGYGYVRYKLYQGDNEVSLLLLPQTEKLADVEFSDKILMAVPYMIFTSQYFEGRGQSIYDGGKTDNFDALDEIWSQWLYAIRQSRPKTYIPTNLLPRNENTGEPLKPNPFDNMFIQVEQSMSEDDKSNIELIQPVIPHESYVQSYVTALDLCLQGIISPSTLGIDTKKLDNAEAQREKEKTTLYTRNKIVKSLQSVLPKLIEIVLRVYAELNKQDYEDIEIDITFGEYANPSFESQVETVAKAKQGGIMSLEACVDELYGDTKDEKWKSEEVQRLKSEQGISEVSEMSFKNDLGEYNGL